MCTARSGLQRKGLTGDINVEGKVRINANRKKGPKKRKQTNKQTNKMSVEIFGLLEKRDVRRTNERVGKQLRKRVTNS